MIRDGFIRHSFTAAITAFALFSSVLVARADVGITINGNSVAVYPAPIMQTGRVFVPLRGVFENLGASVVYNNGQINATGNNTEISLTIGSTQATVNGSPATSKLNLSPSCKCRASAYSVEIETSGFPASAAVHHRPAISWLSSIMSADQLRFCSRSMKPRAESPFNFSEPAGCPLRAVMRARTIGYICGAPKP